MQDVSVTFFNDDNGAPGTVIETQVITANNGQTIGGSTQSASLNVRLNTNVTLATGTYWVSIHPTFDVGFGQDASTALYAWFQSGDVGNSYDRGDAAGVFEADDNDMMFTVDGTRDISDFLPEVNEEIADIETSQDASPILVDLTNTFTDPDDDDNAITIEVTSNSNDALITTSFNNSRELVLTLAPGESGVADITLTATSNGLTVDESFSILVIPVFSTYPYVESFDNDEGAFPLGWENQFITNFDWFVNDGGTPSGGTGPLGDNTSGSGFYVYAEATPIIDDGDIDTASVISPIFDFTALTTPELRFAYHMFGAGIGTLNVNVIPVGTTDTTNVFTISGQQQMEQADPYINAFVSLGAFAGQTVRLEFVAVNGLEGDGTSFRNDIAFDDVVIIEQPNNDLSVVSITPTDGDFVTGLSDVTAVFRNDGVNAQASFDAELSLNGNLLATETVTPTVPLERGEEFSYTFTQQVDIVQAGSNEITVNALLVGDDIPENNELSVSVVAGNTPFLGQYTAVQLTGGLTFGPTFSLNGVSFLDLQFVSNERRSFDAQAFPALGAGQPAATFTFTLVDGAVTFDDLQTTFLAAGATPLLIGTGSVPGEFDVADPSAFTLTVAEDAGASFGGPATVLFQLFINEAPTAVSLDSDNIDEGAPAGAVVGTLSGVDSNPNDFLSFEVTGGVDAASFDTNGAQLISTEVFNATTQDTYEIEVTVTDLTGGEFTDSFTITVNDVTLDAAPVLSVTAATENGFTIYFTDLAAVGITFAVDISPDGFDTLLVEDDGSTDYDFTIYHAEVIT